MLSGSEGWGRGGNLEICKRPVNDDALVVQVAWGPGVGWSDREVEAWTSWETGDVISIHRMVVVVGRLRGCCEQTFWWCGLILLDLSDG